MNIDILFQERYLPTFYNSTAFISLPPADSSTKKLWFEGLLIDQAATPPTKAIATTASSTQTMTDPLSYSSSYFSSGGFTSSISDLYCLCSISSW